MEEVISSDKNILLFTQYYENRSEQNFETIFNENIGLIYFVSKKYFLNSQIPEDEMYSLGSLALYRAIESFELTKGNKFSTYAVKCIYYAYLGYIKEQKKSLDTLSLDAPIKANEDDESTLMDILKDDSPSSLELYEKKELINVISFSMGILSARNREMLSMRFGIGTKQKNVTEIAAYFGVSKTYVSACIKNSLLKLKKVIKLDAEGNIAKINTYKVISYETLNAEEKYEAEKYMLRLSRGYLSGSRKTNTEIGRIYDISAGEVAKILKKVKSNNC